MRTIHGATLLIAAVGLAACAADTGERVVPPAPAAAADPTPSGLAGIDEDADGFITQDELQGHYKSEFGAADLDRDTRLSGTEMAPESGFMTQAEALGRDPGSPDFALTEDEYVQGRLAEFEAADLNNDGQVSLEEYQRVVVGR